MIKLTFLLLIAIVFGIGTTSSDATQISVDSLYAKMVVQADSTASVKVRQKALENFSEQHSKYAPVYRKLAEVYLAEDTPHSRLLAEEAIRRAILLAPHNPSYQLFLGDVMLARGFRYNAENHYDDVIAKFSDAPDVAFNAGRNAVREFMLTKDRPVDRAESMQEFIPKAWNRAVKLLEKCIELDPDYRDAYYQLGLAHLEYDNPVGLVEVMSRLLQRFPDDTDGLMFLALAYQRRGQFDRADKLYAAALSQMTPDERAMMENIDLIASKKDSTALALADSSSEAWVNSPDYRRFWEKRDPLLLTDINERRLEHYGRVAYANLRFSVPSRGEEGWKTVRGQTYIKFGRYLHRTVRTVPLFTEIWYYEGFKFTFRSMNGLDKWGFAGEVGPSSAPDVLGDDGAALHAGNAFVASDLASGRWFAKPFKYTYLDDKYPVPTTASWMHDREAFEKEPPRFIDPFIKQKYSLPHLMAAFRQGDSIRVELAYAVPVSKLKRSDSGVRLDDGLFLFDNQWNSVYREVDSLAQTNASLPDTITGYLLRTHTVRVKPGDYFVASEVGDRQGGSIGTFREKYHFSVADSGVAMSDLLLAGKIEPLIPFPEKRQDLRIVPNPRRTFHRHDPVYIYLEVYNLKRDDFGQTHYEITYQLAPPDPKEVDPTLFLAVDFSKKQGVLNIQAQKRENDIARDARTAVEQFADGTPDAGEDRNNQRDSRETDRRDNREKDRNRETDLFLRGEKEQSPGVHYQVKYVLPQSRLKKEFAELAKNGIDMSRAITAEYEGRNRDDFTFLQIDVAQVPTGIYQLIVTIKDLQTQQRSSRQILFRLIE